VPKYYFAFVEYCRHDTKQLSISDKTKTHYIYIYIFTLYSDNAQKNTGLKKPGGFKTSLSVLRMWKKERQ